jgi:hypothetical protein
MLERSILMNRLVQDDENGFGLKNCEAYSDCSESCIDCPVLEEALEILSKYEKIIEKLIESLPLRRDFGISKAEALIISEFVPDFDK